MRPPGPISDYVLDALAGLAAHGDYRAGRITRAEYAAALDTHADELLPRLDGRRGLLEVAKDYPPDFDASADAILESLVADGILPALPDAPFDEFRARMRADYDHNTRRTSIHPDDARLAYFISMAVQPKRLLVVGSYYGYWAVWAMPGVAAASGHAVLVDPDREVSALAERNFDALGYGACSTVHAKVAEDVFPDIEPGLNLVLLDAAGSGDHPDPAYHGKGIYGFLVEPIYELMRDGALLVVHNDAPHDASPDGDGDEREPELDRFHTFCREHFRNHRVPDTVAGFGVYLK